MIDYYYCQDWGTQFPDTIQHILLSYGVAYYKGKIRSFKKELRHAENIFLDCGAYTLRNTFSKYPLEDYIEWIHTFDTITKVATVDVIGNYPDTVKYALACFDLDSSVPWIPVLQGVTIQDYLDCVTLYTDAGIDLSKRLVAIGGLKSKEPLFIKALLYTFRHFKIHAFGMTITNLSSPIVWNSIHSTDSGTWKSRPRTTAQKMQQLTRFTKRLNQLRENYELQQKLELF